MTRKSSKTTPSVMGGTLYSNDAWNGTRVNSPEWAVFLAEKRTFYYDADGRPGYVSFTARCETRRKGCLWYAFSQHNKKLFKAYVGRTESLDGNRLEATSKRLYEIINAGKEENLTK